MKKRYLSVQKWLDYYWAKNPEWTPLFFNEHNWEKDHKIKLITQIMFRLDNDYPYQAYGGFSDRTCWVYCRVTDHSKRKPKIHTKEELIQYQISQTKFSKYNWSSEDLKMTGSDYWELSCKLTEEMLNKLLEDPKNLKKFNGMMDPTINPESPEWWYNTMPHKEKPIKIYVAGGDDSSYTQLVETADEALEIIERWKIKPPQNPEIDWPGSYFTN